MDECDFYERIIMQMQTTIFYYSKQLYSQMSINYVYKKPPLV